MRVRDVEETMEALINMYDSIQDATRGDAAILARLIRAAFGDVALRFSLTPENCPAHPSNYTEGWVQADFARGVNYFILEVGGDPAGCVALEAAEEGLWHLERLAVLPEHRRLGYGRALVLHALSQAKARGASRVSIAIIADHTELKGWYKGLGFAETGIRDFDHLPFSVCFMETPLRTNT